MEAILDCHCDLCGHTYDYGYQVMSIAQEDDCNHPPVCYLQVCEACKKKAYGDRFDTRVLMDDYLNEQE